MFYLFLFFAFFIKCSFFMFVVTRYFIYCTSIVHKLLCDCPNIKYENFVSKVGQHLFLNRETDGSISKFRTFVNVYQRYHLLTLKKDMEV